MCIQPGGFPMKRFIGAALTIGALLVLAVQVSAHHSFAAEFDGTKCREFAGTLTKVDWQNRHGYFFMDIKDADGTVHNWSSQTYAIITLKRAGIDRQMFIENVGKRV
jgi:hypothetical protein